jgi:hypothetical protein
MTKQNPVLIHKLSDILLDFEKETKKIPNSDKQGIAEAKAQNIVKMVEILGNAKELADAVKERSDDDMLLELASKIN